MAARRRETTFVQGSTTNAKLEALKVKRVTMLKPGPDGTTVAVVLHEPKPRRVSKRWRRLEKFVQRMADAQQTTHNDYLARHERSNERKRNGFLKDFAKNWSRAQRRGRKKLKLRWLDG